MSPTRRVSSLVEKIDIYPFSGWGFTRMLSSNVVSL